VTACQHLARDGLEQFVRRTDETDVDDRYAFARHPRERVENRIDGTAGRHAAVHVRSVERCARGSATKLARLAGE